MQDHPTFSLSSMIYQLVYLSRYAAETGGALSTVRDILQTSQNNNYRDNITGFLIFDKSSFWQILEGEQTLVDAAYARISNDPRHDGLHLIAARQVEARDFPEWSMGGFIRSTEAQDIYARHGFDGEVTSEKPDADRIIALAHDLLAFEQARQGQRIIDVMSR